MRKEILVNATPAETRVALTEDGRTVEIFHERRDHQGLVGNIYLGRVHRVLPGMQAAFVSIGLDRDAFLYVEDAVPHPVDLEIADNGEEAAESSDLSGGPGGPPSPRAEERARIDDLVKEGQEIVVQVAKDPLAGKGPRVTANLSLPGRTVVALPGVRQVGISRRITDEFERERLRQILEKLIGDAGLIARTAAQGSAEVDFLAERDYLRDLEGRIRQKAGRATAPALLHRELPLALRVVRDLGTPEIAAIRVDDEQTQIMLAEFLASVAPFLVSRLERYDRPEPIFDLFGVEAEIEKALKSRVELPSGGSVVIHQTEALVAIDINTGKFVGKDALESTVFQTNLEAIPEVARQIRLRDLGGLLVVDFIDMEDPEHRRETFERFEAELSRDRARTRILQISEFGLVEVTRQRSRGNLEKILTRLCPDCGGTGRVKTDLTVALGLSRALMKMRSVLQPGDKVRIKVRPSLAQLLEEDRRLLAEVVEKLEVDLELLPDETLPPAGYEILRS